MKKVESNIWKLYLIKILRCFMLMVSVITLFFQENGLTMKDIFLLQALFSLTVIALEVPTGYFADRFGRKKSIVIGGIFIAAGWIVYSLSFDFWQFFGAETLLGIGLSFASGADSAMMFDTLLEKGRASEYQKIEGRGMGIAVASESLASIVGGYLALVSLRYPLYWDAAISLLIAPVALSLVETNGHTSASEKREPEGMIRLVKFCLHDHASVKWLIIFSSFVNVSTMVMFWFTQPYLVELKVPLRYFGIASAVLLGTSAFFSWHAHRIQRRLGRKMILSLLVAFPVLGYFVLGSTEFLGAAIFLLLFNATRGLNNPVSVDYINKLVSSDIRATVLSARNLVCRVGFSAAGPFLGWLSDAYSLKYALLASGVMFLAIGTISLTFLRKYKVF